MICEPQDRIGRESFDQIKKHKFFKDLDWDNIKSTKAPYPPNVILKKSLNEDQYIFFVLVEWRRRYNLLSQCRTY